MPKRKAVDSWFTGYENPMKPVVERIREIVLAADPRIDECIKWQAPTFTYEGNLASFFPKSREHASLMFHLGAKIPGTFARLEGSGDTGRVMKLASVDEANAAKRELESIVKAWCAWREAVAKKPAKKKSAKKPAAKPALAKRKVVKTTPAARPTRAKRKR